MTSKRIRVLVVDDSAFARKVMREVLEGDPRFEVVGTARDGLDGLERIAELKPDVVTLDLVMPNLDGVGLLRALSTLTIPQLPRVIVVTMSEDSSDLAVSALQSGAIALVHKPTALATDRLFELSDELRSTVALAASVAPIRARLSIATEVSVVAPAPAPQKIARGIVAIGASTGGPQALTALLKEFPKDFPLPIVIALHMPVGYTEALARRLDQLCALEVLEGYEGVQLLVGRVVLARAGMHLKIRRGAPSTGYLDLLPINKPHRPSVDVLLESAAAAFGDTTVGVVLTGMGDDGLLGARAIRAVGGTVLTEAESSCVVYGMPRSVMEAGLSTAEAPLERIVAEICRRV